MPVAKWMLGKAKELSDGGRLGGREVSFAERWDRGRADLLRKVEKLAQMACDVGSGLVKPSKESGEAGKKEDQGARAAAAVEWLLWATQLLEVRDSGAAKALQVGSPFRVACEALSLPRSGHDTQVSCTSVSRRSASSFRMGERGINSH